MNGARKLINCDAERCTGCQICEFVCSATKENRIQPRLSRIRVVRIEPMVTTTIACRLCEDPSCVKSCPRKALSVGFGKHEVRVDDAKCDGCGWCIQACSFGSISIHPEKKTVVMCDLCDGEPQCVEFCPKKALSYSTLDGSAQRNRITSVRKLYDTRSRAK
jgi:Fe-S-cluster-containing hydrogenase component 2